MQEKKVLNKTKVQKIVIKKGTIEQTKGDIQNINEELKLFINIGFLGGLTTFSAYTSDIFSLLQKLSTFLIFF